MVCSTSHLSLERGIQNPSNSVFGKVALFIVFFCVGYPNAYVYSKIGGKTEFLIGQYRSKLVVSEGLVSQTPVDVKIRIELSRNWK